MAIKKIKISNFKSFDKIEVELHKLNLLIGANASGKSNFIQVFKFLRDITQYGLDNAISLQGGVEYFRNVNIGSFQDFSLELVSDEKFGFARDIEEKLIGTQPYETTYKIAIKFKKTGLGFEITEDKITYKCEFVSLRKEGEKVKEKEKFGSGEITISNINRKVEIYLNLPEGVPIKEEHIFQPFSREGKLPLKTLLLETPSFLTSFVAERIFGDISIYDFDPKLPKKAVTITGKAELEEDGSNLAIVLKNIKQSSAKRRKFYNLVRELIPFVDDFGVDKFADTLLFKVREIYSKNRFLPASLMSDGTINLTALIIALYFEDKPLKIMEEPERNVHPYLISRIGNMMREASQKTQIVSTTHNPEMIKHVDLDDVLLISRDKDGFSRICRPIEKEEIKGFLKKEMGIEELYIRNLLEM